MTHKRMRAPKTSQLGYYFYLKSSDDLGTELYVVMSSLRRNLTERLLLFAAGEEVRGCQVVAYAEDIEFKPGVPAAMPGKFVRLGFFVEPRRFTDALKVAGGGAVWNLLDEEDARALLVEWQQDPRYSDKPVDANRPNYFRNTVDHFEHELEKRWSHSTK